MHYIPHMEIGAKVSRWTVEAGPERKGHNHYWLCLCECGKRKMVCQYTLSSGKSKSCGCLIAETTRARRTKHGFTAGVRGGYGVRPPVEYSAWQNAKRRCHDPKSARYPQYGGRGIQMCERWLHSFENFYADMGDRPFGYSLDRIDPNGPYDPSNCRWATNDQQRNNKARTVRYAWSGEMLTLAQIARATGLKRLVIWKRLKRGWSLKDAALTPLKH